MEQAFALSIHGTLIMLTVNSLVARMFRVVSLTLLFTIATEMEMRAGYAVTLLRVCIKEVHVKSWSMGSYHVKPAAHVNRVKRTNHRLRDVRLTS